MNESSISDFPADSLGVQHFPDEVLAGMVDALRDRIVATLRRSAENAPTGQNR